VRNSWHSRALVDLGGRRTLVGVAVVLAILVLYALHGAPKKVAANASAGRHAATSPAPPALAAVPKTAPALTEPALVRRWIRGTVTARNGATLANAELCLLGEQSNFSTQGYATQTRTVPESGDSLRFDIVLEPELPGNLQGIVLDATGGVVSGAAVTVRLDAAPDLVAMTRSNDKGEFRLHADPGPVTITAQAEAFAPAMARVNAPAESLRLVLAPASSLEGYVVDEDTGDPIGGAMVSALPRGFLQSWGIGVAANEKGHFELTGLHAGEYILTASASRWSGEIAIRLGVGEALNELQVEVRRATALNALVTAGGKACPKGGVQLAGPANLWGITDADGKLTIEGVRPGTYQATVQCQGSIPWSGELLVASEPVTRQWELDPGCAVTGRVEGPDGEPLARANVVVQLPRTPPAPVAHCTTDEAGNFECKGIDPGKYDVRLGGGRDSATVRIELSAGRGLDPIVLRASPSAAILVRIAHSQPGTSNRFQVFARATDKPPAAATATLDGQMRLDLPLGDYFVYFGPTSKLPDEARRVRLVANGQVAHVELDAPPLLSISGAVLDEQGVPVPDLWIHAESADIEGGGLPLGVPALTSAQGEFAIDQLLPGEYHLATSERRARLTVKAVLAGARNVVVRDLE
jgi:protocatechuate 3,4-dioxygenase beta subunit